MTEHMSRIAAALWAGSPSFSIMIVTRCRREWLRSRTVAVVLYDRVLTRRVSDEWVAICVDASHLPERPR